MGKPSIFNSDYHRRVKKRKKNIILAVLLCIIVIILLVFVSSGKGNFKKPNFNFNNIFNFSSIKKNSAESVKKPVTKPVAKNTNTAQTKKEEAYPVTLSSGKQIKAVYELKDNSKVFKSISPEDNTINYTISPSGKNIIIFDSKVQNIIYLDNLGSKQDITNAKFVSTSGTAFDKNEILSTRPDYIWCGAPKFIDEDNIAYISQLPWFNKTTKFVWVENVKTKANTRIDNLSGDDVKFESLQGKGLPVVIDGVTKFLSASGNVSQ